MAAGPESLTRLESMLQCAICTEIIIEPRAFPCMHYFCQRCIDGMTPHMERQNRAWGNGSTGPRSGADSLGNSFENSSGAESEATMSLEFDQPSGFDASNEQSTEEMTVELSGQITTRQQSKRSSYTTNQTSVIYQCPLCRAPTRSTHIRPIHIITELLDVYHLNEMEANTMPASGTARQSLSRSGDSEDAYWRGSSFESSYEQSAGKQARRMNSSHRHNVYCPKHPDNLAQIYCIPCSKLVCDVCNVTSHKKHDAQTIDEALETVVPCVTKSVSQLQTTVQDNETMKMQTGNQILLLEGEYENMSKAIDEAGNVIINQIMDECEQLKARLANMRQTQMKQFETFQNDNAERIEHQRRLLRLSDTVMSQYRGPALLYALQTNIAHQVEKWAEDSIQLPSTLTKINARFEPLSTPWKHQYIGNIEKATKSKEESIKCLLGDLIDMRTELIPDHGPKVSRISQVGPDLVCVDQDTNALRVCSPEGNYIKTISLEGKGHCRKAVRHGQHLLLATSVGLIQVDFSNPTSTTLVSTDISDVAICGRMAYALDNTNGRVLSLKLFEHVYLEGRSFELNKPYKKHECNSLVVNEQFIYVCERNAHIITQYEHDGTHVMTHGNLPSSQKQLKHPYICGIDAKGSLLVADESNNALKCLHKSGRWQVLPVEGLVRPVFALIEGALLFVAEHKRPLKRFQFV